MLYILRDAKDQIIGHGEDLDALRSEAQQLGVRCDIHSVEIEGGQVVKDSWLESCNEPIFEPGSQWRYSDEELTHVTHRMVISELKDDTVYYLEVFHTDPVFTTFCRRCGLMDWDNDVAQGRIVRV
jgi:hypothetical protein